MSTEELSIIGQFKEILPVVWGLFKRRPFLAFAPVTFYFKWFEPETLDQWVAEVRESTLTRTEDE